MLEESFLPTVRTLMNAPATSPLAEVDISNVVELLVELTRASALIKPSTNTGVRDIPAPSVTNPSDHSVEWFSPVGPLLSLGGVRSRLFGSAHVWGDVKGLHSPRGASLRQDPGQPGAEQQRDRQHGPADAAAAARAGTRASAESFKFVINNLSSQNKFTIS